MMADAWNNLTHTKLMNGTNCFLWKKRMNMKIVTNSKRKMQYKKKSQYLKKFRDSKVMPMLQGVIRKNYLFIFFHKKISFSFLNDDKKGD